MAGEKLVDAKKAIVQDLPPRWRSRARRAGCAAKTLDDATGKWLAGTRLADSTKTMRKSIVDRDILPAFQDRQLNWITADDPRPPQLR